MAAKVFTLPPGVCRCSVALSSKVSGDTKVKRISGADVAIESLDGLRKGRCVSVRLDFEGGPTMTLLARVTSMRGREAVLSWLYSEADEAQKLAAALAACSARAPPARPRAEKRARVLRSDVEAVIRKKAVTVRATDLAARHEKLQVLDVQTIKNLIEESVDNALLKQGDALRDEARQRLLEEAEESFKARLAAFQAEKADLKAQAKKLQSELGVAKGLLQEERRKVMEADRFTVSDAGMIELEQRLARMLDRAIAAGGVGGQLAEDMRAAVARLLDDERAKISERAQEAQSDRIGLLERKIDRLARSLQDTEREREKAERRARALEAAGGVGFRNVVDAGLDDDDPQKEKKLLLLKQIFEDNKAMRAQLHSRGKLPRGKRRARSRADPAAAAAPPAAGPAPAELVAAGGGEEAPP